MSKKGAKFWFWYFVAVCSLIVIAIGGCNGRVEETNRVPVYMGGDIETLNEVEETEYEQETSKEENVSSVATETSKETENEEEPSKVADETTVYIEETATEISTESEEYVVKLSDEQIYMLECINTVRSENGLSKLEYNYELNEFAKKRATDIITTWSHTTPEGETVHNENLARYFNDHSDPIKAVVEAWLNHTGHRETLLNSSYTSVAIGVLRTDGNDYYSAEFR